MLTYCKHCVMPDTKPDLYLDEHGVCNACRSYEKRTEVDWGARYEELLKVLEKYRRSDGSNWDCIVPVSGGKDSTYQVVRMLQLGLNPLCVTSSTCDLSPLGRANIENLKRLGVDHIEVSPNPLVRAKWGENSQNEYGGPAAAAENNVLNRRWLEEFGGLLGMRVSDLIGQEGIEAKHLIHYTYPSDEELKRVGVTGLFLGHYLPWDGLSNTLIAQANGFHSYHKVVEGSMVNYENLDNHQTGIHDYFKFLKFGFGRATDLACLHIRRGRLTRQDGLEAVRRLDGLFPWEYLGKPLRDILRPLDMTEDEFIRVCDKFTNKKIFKRDVSGALLKDRDGNLTKINYDNV